MKRGVLFVWVALALSLGGAGEAGACAVCYGDPDSAMTAGLNNAVLFLLGIVGIVQGGLIALFLSFRRRMKSRERRRAALRLIEGGAR